MEPLACGIQNLDIIRMANLIKIILILIVVSGIALYFIGQAPIWFSENPLERTRVVPPTKSFISFPVFQSPSQPPSYQQQPAIPDYLIPQGYTREQLSPYFQKIRISSAYASWWGGYPSQISFYSYLSGNEKIDITGWRIKSNIGEILVPKAVNIYEPAGFAMPEDIVFLGNSYLNIYSNFSPISRNLRLNKCIGYLQNSYDFNPALPQSCPLPYSRSEISYLSGQCQSYIFSLGGCRLPDVSFYNLLPGNERGDACRNFLNNVSYNSCFEKHRSDLDFFSNEWRVWTGQNILDPQHDRVRLFDNQGLLVDQYIY